MNRCMRWFLYRVEHYRLEILDIDASGAQRQRGTDMVHSCAAPVGFVDDHDRKRDQLFLLQQLLNQALHTI